MPLKLSSTSIAMFSNSAIANSRKPFKALWLRTALIVLGFGSLPALSQAAFAQTPSEPAEESVDETICTYDASSGAPNPLGDRASLTVRGAGGNTEFIYERLPAIVSSNRSSKRADVDNQRTLTLYETTVDEARQLLADDSTYYAVLLGLAPDDPFVDRGFGLIDQTLVCTQSQTEEAVAPPVPVAPPAPQPPLPPPAQ